MEDKQYGINILVATQLLFSHNYFLPPTSNYLPTYLPNLLHINLTY
jgi:hypothetical protein